METPEKPRPGGKSFPRAPCHPGVAGSPAWPPVCEHFPKEEMQVGEGFGGAVNPGFVEPCKEAGGGGRGGIRRVSGGASWLSGALLCSPAEVSC